MKANDFLRKIFSFGLWANLLSMLLVVVALCFAVKVCIDLYTHHGEKIVVPDIRHKNFSDAEHLLVARDLKVVVSDTGYVPGMRPDCILEQSPAPGERVKSGHVIYLTVNATQTPTITVPDVIDNSSLREAMAKLSAMGFKLTQPTFVDGEKDWVYGLTVKGLHVVAGDKVSVNDYITIEVGSGQRDVDMDVNYTDAPIEDAKEDEFYESGDVDEFHEVP